jgi:dephospho-CoA kinase
MIILGLTGSIAMGKSTAAVMFRQLRVPVYDADAAVHRLLGHGGAAVAAIDRLFPGVVEDGAVSRPALGARVFGDEAALRRLEGVLHPLVRDARERFLARERRRGTPLVVVDIPLLYETGAERECDAVAVVSAPAFLQMQRLRRRPNFSEGRVAAVLSRQMPDAEKRRRADFVVPSGLGKALTRKRIAWIVEGLQRSGRRG